LPRLARLAAAFVHLLHAPLEVTRVLLTPLALRTQLGEPVCGLSVDSPALLEGLQSFALGSFPLLLLAAPFLFTLAHLGGTAREEAPRICRRRPGGRNHEPPPRSETVGSAHVHYSAP
jgi:hypothetical protein